MLYIYIYTHTHTHMNVHVLTWASLVALVVKNPPANAGNMRHGVVDSWIEKMP